MNWKRFAVLLKETAFKWNGDNAPRLAAALAYYTIFSLSPLLVIILGLVGWIFGGRVDSSQVVQRMGDIVGPQAASMIQNIIRHAHRPGTGITAGIISVIILLVGASGVFYELHASLDTIWGVQRKSTGDVLVTIKTRISSFLVIFLVGFLLMAAVAASAGVYAFGKFMGDALPGVQYLLHAANLTLSFGVIAVLLAVIYKMLPEADIKWGDVWVGAAVTSLLFAIGKLVIGLYLARSTMGSLYGAAGSLIIFLAFIYYSAQIFFFGAEFTCVYANMYGSWVIPSGRGKAEPAPEPRVEKHPSKQRPEERRRAANARASRKK